LKLKLTKRGLQLLQQKHRLRVRLDVTTVGPSGVHSVRSRVITLREPAPRAKP